MVANFVSADYGWRQLPNGKEEAWVLFKAGKNRQGYFTSEDILAQAMTALDILSKHFPDEDHVLVYDNASTHLKHADDALSATKMPKGISKPDKNWGVLRTLTDENGLPVYGPDGKVVKTKVNMDDGELADGTPQPLYFPAGHKLAGLFKGMATILTK